MRLETLIQMAPSMAAFLERVFQHGGCTVGLNVPPPDIRVAPHTPDQMAIILSAWLSPSGRYLDPEGPGAFFEVTRNADGWPVTVRLRREAADLIIALANIVDVAPGEG